VLRNTGNALAKRFKSNKILTLRVVIGSILQFNETGMTTHQKELLARLQEAGWELISADEPNEWWADEIWLIRSTWSPQSAQFYLTFLVDPQLDLHRKRRKHEGVWAVAATATLPVHRHSVGKKSLFSLGHGWEERLPDFISEISNLRRPSLPHNHHEPKI
jgi:hypothetical protein